MKKNSFALLLFISVSLLFFTSCEKEDPPQPPLPPQESFIMDFSEFQNVPGEKKSLDEQNLVTYQNISHAVESIVVWNTIVSVTMAVPAASYIAALNQTPEYQGDNTWKWEYSVASGNFTYSAKLITSRQSNEEFKAEMYITKTGMGAFTEFKWFEGMIRYDRTHAIWTLYQNPADPKAFIEIEWNMDWENEVSDITYTNILEGHQDFGGYIKYEITDDPDFNAMYTISGSLNIINIEWNRESKFGRIKNPVVFGNDLWHCWNELLQDTDCN